MEIVLETFKEFETWNNWLINLILPEQIDAQIYVRDTMTTYFYKAIRNGEQWSLVSDGTY